MFISKNNTFNQKIVIKRIGYYEELLIIRYGNLVMSKFNFNITSVAANYLLKNLKDNKYFRVGVKSSGCEGFEYVMLFENKLSEKDFVFKISQIQIIVDNKSIHFLEGCTLDFSKNLMSFGLKIINPNKKSECGCGKSFSI